MSSIRRDSALCGRGVEALLPYALPDWELVRAPRGAGHWLCSHRSEGPIALAAPGVPLDLGEDEALDRWRCGFWLIGEDEDCAIDVRRPEQVIEVRLATVLRSAGADWAPWLRRVTTTLVERTYSYGFVGTAASPPRERRAQETQIVFSRLVDEAVEAFPDLRIPGVTAASARMPLRMPRNVRAFRRRAERRDVAWGIWRRALSAIGRRLRRRGDGTKAPEPPRLLG